DRSNPHRDREEREQISTPLILHSAFCILHFSMTTKEKPNVPISCEYDHLEFVPKQFGGTQDENGPEKKPRRPRKTKRPYAELRAASAFSFLDGASLPEDLVYQAAEKDLPAMALVDTNGVYGAPRFYTAAKKAGFK